VWDRKAVSAGLRWPFGRPAPVINGAISFFGEATGRFLNPASTVCVCVRVCVTVRASERWRMLLNFRSVAW
jgi:hypothetical protein